MNARGWTLLSHANMSQGSAAPPTASQESVRSGRSPKKSTHVSKHAGCKKKGHHSEKSRPASSASLGGLSRHGQVRNPCWPVLAKKVQPNQPSASSQWKKKSKSHKKDKSGK